MGKNGVHLPVKRIHLLNVSVISIAPLFKRQHAVKRNLVKYNPHIIFTSGYVQKEQLKTAKNLNGIIIEVLGSSRSTNISKNINLISGKSKTHFSNSKTCLVIPEGIESEIHLLFKFSLKCAKKYPDILFIWRLHPLFTFDVLVAKNKIYKYLPDNIILSNEDLNQDCGRSEWVLYRGSSAVIQAVFAGTRPIYYHIPGEMKIDPLYEIDKWKLEIETINDFKYAINNSSNKNTGYKELYDYCNKANISFDITKIINIL